MADDGEDSSFERLQRRRRMLEAFRASSVWSISDWIVQRYPRTFAWGSLFTSTALTFGGIIAGSYVLRHAERPAGWAVTSFSIGITGFYLTGRSIVNLCCPTSSSTREGVYNVREETALNYENAYFAANPEALRRFQAESRNHPQERIFSRHGPDSSSDISTHSDFPELSYSDASTDINLNYECDDYRPKSTELAIRYYNQNRGMRKKVVRREWSSTPNIRLNPMDDLMMSMEAMEQGMIKAAPETRDVAVGTSGLELVDLADQAIGGAESIVSLETSLIVMI